MKHLFIGGYADGEFLDVINDAPRWRITHKESCKVTPADENNISTVAFTSTTYKREYITDYIGHRYAVYVIPNINIVRELIRGYRRPHVS